MGTRSIDRREFLAWSAAAATAMALPVPLPAQQSMRRRPIPATGEDLPVMGLGNSQAFRTNDYQTSRTLVEIFTGAGGRVIDTRDDSTVVLGRLMQDLDLHDELFLATNISADTGEGMGQIQRAQQLQMKKSLDLLQINHLNNIDENWSRMRGWKEAGHARFIGVAIANARYYDALEQLMATGTMDFVQLNYSLLEPGSGDRLLPLARDRGIAVIINRPFVNGDYFRRVQGRTIPPWTADFDCRSWAQFSLKWILSNPVVNCVLTETANPDHARDNLAAGFGRLPDLNQRDRMLAFMQSTAG